jgi:alpha-L-rhamnosidase
MVFVPELYDYYQFTGDIGFIRAEWPNVQRQMAWDAQQVGSSGLFAVSEATGWDWNVGQTSGELSYVNAVYYQALLDASRLAGALGDPSAGSYLAAAAKLRGGVNAQLWDQKLGIYDASTSLRGVVIQDANVYPVLTGIAPPARGASIMGIISKALATPYGTLNAPTPPPSQYSQIISPYMGSFQLAADFQAGRPDLGLALMRTEWGRMVRHDPGGTTWERIHPAGGTLAGADSAAHAWGTGPTWVLSRYVLGAAPASPGFSTWSVAPQPGDLAWAQGAVPTPHGTLAVRWRRGAGGRSFALTVKAPGGTSGEVAVPLLGPDRTIKRNGVVVWRSGAAARGISARRGGNAVIFAAQRGSQSFSWAAARRRSR